MLCEQVQQSGARSIFGSLDQRGKSLLEPASLAEALHSYGLDVEPPQACEVLAALNAMSRHSLRDVGRLRAPHVPRRTMRTSFSEPCCDLQASDA